jgi:membrane protein implicated in regulation of membrane protease activity
MRLKDQVQLGLFLLVAVGTVWLGQPDHGKSLVVTSVALAAFIGWRYDSDPEAANAPHTFLTVGFAAFGPALLWRVVGLSPTIAAVLGFVACIVSIGLYEATARSRRSTDAPSPRSE